MVAPVLIDTAQLRDRDATSLVLPACDLGRLVSGGCRAGEILLPGVGVEMRPGAALRPAHRLALIVGREHVRLVLAPERLRLLRRRIEQPCTLADRLCRGVGDKRQLAGRLAAGDHITAVDIAAEHDVRLLAHGSMMACGACDLDRRRAPLHAASEVALVAVLRVRSVVMPFTFASATTAGGSEIADYLSLAHALGAELGADLLR